MSPVVRGAAGVVVGLAAGFLLWKLPDHPVDVNRVGDWVWRSLTDLAKVAPLGTLLAAVVAAIVAYVTYKGNLEQKTKADNRSAWWNRVQWGIDASLSDDEQTRVVGTEVVLEMFTDIRATREDRRLLGVMAAAVQTESSEGTDVVNESAAQGDAEEPVEVADGSEVTPTPSRFRRWCEWVRARVMRRSSLVESQQVRDNENSERSPHEAPANPQ